MPDNILKSRKSKLLLVGYNYDCCDVAGWLAGEKKLHFLGRIMVRALAPEIEATAAVLVNFRHSF
jgi:hypothetical protein